MNQVELNSFGLSARDLKTIIDIFYQYPSVERVHIFGSRAKGGYHAGSDIDLAIMNAGLDELTLTRVSGEFAESSLPYKVDLVNYHSIDNPAFVDHIDRVGKLFYARDDYSNR